jgi:hypothetical protein
MPIVPHNYNYFSAFALLLKPELIGSPDVDGSWDMGVEEVCAYLDALVSFLAEEPDVKRGAFPTPMVIQILGGDPFLRLDDLDRVLDIAKLNHFQGEVSTTGLWVESSSQVISTLDRLDGKLHAIFVDTSRLLLDRIGLQRLELLIVEARRRRFGVQIRCGVASDAPFPMELLGLDVMNSDTSIIQVVPMTHSLDAQDAFLLESPPLRRRCAESFAFFVTPGGEVYPCSRGAGLSALRLGSLKTESVSEILAHVRPRATLRHLRENGPYSLYEAMRRGDHADRLSHGYVDACHFHRHVLGDPELSQIAEDAAIYTNPSPSTKRQTSLPILKG